MLTDHEREELKKLAPNITDEQLDHFFNMIRSFVKLFGMQEYSVFHNEYLLPLYKKTFKDVH